MIGVVIDVVIGSHLTKPEWVWTAYDFRLRYICYFQLSKALVVFRYDPVLDI